MDILIVERDKQSFFISWTKESELLLSTLSKMTWCSFYMSFFGVRGKVTNISHFFSVILFYDIQKMIL